MSNILLLTATDAKNWLNALGKTGAGSFNFTATMTEAMVQSVVDTKVGTVKSKVGEKWRSRLRRVEGEKVVWPAFAGQTTAQTGLTPISGLRLYKNLSVPYESRTPASALTLGTHYTVTAGGAITFLVALADGDKVAADYDHTAGAMFLDLRDLALALIAEHYATFLPWLGENPMVDKQAAAARDTLEAGNVFVEAIDNLKLIEETRSSSGTIKQSWCNGW